MYVCRVVVCRDPDTTKKKAQKRKCQDVDSSVAESSHTDTVSSVTTDTARKTGKRKRHNVNSSAADNAILLSANDTLDFQGEHSRKKTKQK